MSIDPEALADELDRATTSALPTEQLSARFPALGIADGYAIQRLGIGLRCARGEQAVGIKLGFTSRAKMIQMGVDDVILGQLTGAMAIADDGEADAARFIHPRVEPELAFYLKRDVSGPLSLFEAGAVIEAIAPAIEVIDSRYRDFKFSLTDVIADNSSSSAFVLGPCVLPSTDYANRGMSLEIDGRVVQSGSSAAILGHPLRAIVAAARLAEEHQVSLRAGDLVLAGAATTAVAAPDGAYCAATVHGLGRVGFTLRKGQSDA